MGFLDSIEEEEEDFLENVEVEEEEFLSSYDDEKEDEEEIEKSYAWTYSVTAESYIPAPKISVSDKELKEAFHPDWRDSTDKFEMITSSMKRVECSCGGWSCVASSNRWTTCVKCGVVHIDFKAGERS